MTETEQYPVVIWEDRYSGVYSGGRWIAVAVGWGRDAGIGDRIRVEYVEEGAGGGDVEAMTFWKANARHPWLAVGDTPDEALANLRNRGG